jgi:hypothetical protein
MKSLRREYLFAFLVLVPGIAFGEVSTKVFLRDSNEPLVPVEVNIASQYVDYGQIMVGTELSIVIDSNVAEYWTGKLLIEEEQRNYGVLYPGFSLEAAGPYAYIDPIFYWQEEDKYVQGFNLYTDFPPDVNVGDWFVIDYNAIDYNSVNAYDCNVALYWQDDTQWPILYGLIHHLRFDHVPTRDFNTDWLVDFQDFSILAGYWHDTNCAGPDCESVDLDDSGVVDSNDLILFTEFWLEKTK